MEKANKERWQEFLEESGYNDPAQVDLIPTCRVLGVLEMGELVSKLLRQAGENPDLFSIMEMIGKAFREELGKEANNAIGLLSSGDDKNFKKRKFVNTIDEASLFPVLHKWCIQRIDKATGVSEQRKEDALGFLSRYMKEWREGQPQPIKPNSIQSKGRPTKPFKDMMIDDADGCKLQKMHLIMDGKKGKSFALLILACMKKGWILKPTYTQAKNEFGDIGSKQMYNNYLYENKFTDEELEGAMASLD